MSFSRMHPVHHFALLASIGLIITAPIALYAPQVYPTVVIFLSIILFFFVSSRDREIDRGDSLLSLGSGGRFIGKISGIMIPLSVFFLVCIWTIIFGVILFIADALSSSLSQNFFLSGSYRYIFGGTDPFKAGLAAGFVTSFFSTPVASYFGFKEKNELEQQIYGLPEGTYRCRSILIIYYTLLMSAFVSINMYTEFFNVGLSIFEWVWFATLFLAISFLFIVLMPALSVAHLKSVIDAL